MEVPSAALRDLSTLLLPLYEGARELGYREQQRHTLELSSSVIPFDAAVLALGTYPRGGAPTARDVWLHGRPWEWIESWERVKTQDRSVLFASTRPGVTVNLTIDGPDLEGCEDFVAHSRAWNVAHILATAIVSPTSGLYWFMALYRDDPERPFTEADRLFKEALTPHVFAAGREARLGQLRRLARVSGVHGQSAGVVNQQGTVLEAEPELVELLRKEWPSWQGPELPHELAACVARHTPTRETYGSLVVRVDATDGVKLLHVRRSVPADRLTAREREIARAFSLGETHREIGERLGISPNTVRRHVCAALQLRTFSESAGAGMDYALRCYDPELVVLGEARHGTPGGSALAGGLVCHEDGRCTLVGTADGAFEDEALGLARVAFVSRYGPTFEREQVLRFGPDEMDDEHFARGVAVAGGRDEPRIVADVAGTLFGDAVGRIDVLIAPFELAGRAAPLDASPPLASPAPRGSSTFGAARRSR